MVVHGLEELLLIEISMDCTCADGLVDEISESLPKASIVNIRMGIVVGVVGCPSCRSNYCISLMGKT